MFGITPMKKERRAMSVPEAEAFTPLEVLRREFASLFERAFPTFPVPWEPMWRCEMEEREKEVVVRAELPGYEPAEIRVELTGGVLTITAEHVEATEGEKPEEKVEKRWGKVLHTMTLPEGTDREHVVAVYRNGVLEVVLPKMPAALPRRIEVKT